MSPSDTELSSPELAVCFELHGTAEEDDIQDVIEDKEQEFAENGQEVLYLQTHIVLGQCLAQSLGPKMEICS